MIQRKIAIHDLNLVLIPLRQRRKKLLVHLRAIRALQIVEADDQDRRIRRATPRRPSVSDTSSFGSLLMSYLLNCASVFPSVESRNVAGLLDFPFVTKNYADRIEARNFALRPRTDLDFVVGRNRRLRADQHLDPARQLRRQLAPASVGVCAWQPRTIGQPA